MQTLNHRRWGRRLGVAAVCAALLWSAGGCAPRSSATRSPERYDQPLIITPSRPAPPPAPGAPPPAWAAQGSGAYHDAAGAGFYGVGQAGSTSGNRLLMRTAADNLARRDLSAVLRRYLSALAAGQGPSDESVLDGLVDAALRRAVVSDHWNSAADGDIYALCRLELRRLKELIADCDDLAPAVRKAWLAQADRQHARMAGAP